MTTFSTKSAAFFCIVLFLDITTSLQAAPKSLDPRLEISLFAESPDIRHPVTCIFDHQGRLLVVESHTHFPPPGYEGKAHDRILAFRDSNGDGKANERTIFFEGTTHTMDVAVHYDGSIYIAMRNEILRLTDTNNDGKADQQQRIAFLKTEGRYPHNGLCGLQFDLAGNLYFGMGENLGFPYTLIGSDGVKITDEAEGGNVFRCDYDGGKLKRIATGFWNPFGICRDVFGRMIATDNDPTANGCRLLHIVDGGNYGYQYRYGRSGQHPFISWNGRLPGTLGMIAATGEAPCEIVQYESIGLPSDYRGKALAASWGNHRIEQFDLQPRGSSFSSKAKAIVQGDTNFRPVGIATAPDGSLLITDWVLKDYKLHGAGRIWRLHAKDAKAHQLLPDVLSDAERLRSPRRQVREAEAYRLLQKGKLEPLIELTKANDVRLRAMAYEALAGQAKSRIATQTLAERFTQETNPALSAMLLRLASDACRDKKPANDAIAANAEVKLQAMRLLNTPEHIAVLQEYLADADPFVRSAAIRQLGSMGAALPVKPLSGIKNRTVRAGMLLAYRNTSAGDNTSVLRQALHDSDAMIRFLAIKWIADKRIEAFRDPLNQGISEPGQSPDLYLGFATALARLDGASSDDKVIMKGFIKRINDPKTPAGLKALLLRSLPSVKGSAKAIKTERVGRLLNSTNPQLTLEAVYVLANRGGEAELNLLEQYAIEEKHPESIRALAITSLGPAAEHYKATLLTFAKSEQKALREEALRSLTRVKLAPTELALLQEVAKKHGTPAAMVDRLAGRKGEPTRPAISDTADWLKLLAGKANADAGSRIFAHANVANCIACHTFQGRGARVGPDLTHLGRGTERAAILESILQPSKNIAPHYVSWNVIDDSGRVRSGFLVHEDETQRTFVDAQGGTFSLRLEQIEEMQPATKSIMPSGLVDGLTDQELRDLLAYLTQRR